MEIYLESIKNFTLSNLTYIFLIRKATVLTTHSNKQNKIDKIAIKTKS